MVNQSPCSSTEAALYGSSLKTADCFFSAKAPKPSGSMRVAPGALRRRAHLPKRPMGASGKGAGPEYSEFLRDATTTQGYALQCQDHIPQCRESGLTAMEITADRVQLQQIFMNLILNAIEAMKETGGDLTVNTQLGENGRLLISVSDTGVGLPKEKTEQIFDAFFTTKPQGSGMGLSVSRSIVESHGGRLWATANSERGATFHFTLPTAAEALQMPATGT